MIQIQKYIAYAITAAALTILLSSTARISLAILSSNKNNVAVDFDVRLDDENDDDEHDVNLNDEPILPINQRKLAVSNGESGPGAVSDVLTRFAQMGEQTRKVDESNLPYKCGVLLYDHQIPGESGDALNTWIRKMVKSNEGATFLSSESSDSKESFLSKVEDQIESVGSKNWTIIHSHANGLAFSLDENILRSWRDTVERHNCQFIAASVFSDPLDHSIKYTKKLFAECNCSMVEFKEKIMKRVEFNQWTGQLDHFLFNSGAASPMEMKDKVRSGVALLKDHFEVVLVDGQADFSEEILRITGWTSHGQVKEASVSDNGLVYSKDLVSKYGKMSTKNGDADFIDAVNHIYHNSLGYLMLQ